MLNTAVKAQRTTLQMGKTYQLRNSKATYYCLCANDGNAKLIHTKTGWSLTAHGTILHPDGTIEWDYSTDGKFETVY